MTKWRIRSLVIGILLDDSLIDYVLEPTQIIVKFVVIFSNTFDFLI